MRRRRATPELDEPQIDLTPLLDVVFVMLIMFIVIAPLLELDKISLAEGSGERTSLRDAGQIAIRVRSDNTLEANGRLVAPENLTGWLQQMRSLYPEATPQLYCDREAHFGSYQMVKNAVENVGYSEMDLVLQPR